MIAKVFCDLHHASTPGFKYTFLVVLNKNELSDVLVSMES
ncbi:hypothetical protein ESCAB7627_3250 [Escherichia albertii TW07627]|uniref:Uncharacterized protein n=1 Tax=Escherichia albertii (strain TW07627) TaxID=502347 RepID=A0ABC9NMD1_ESCAT|nr:hypothetical protein EAKF1_ch1408c [Escherichia albertii KF1]EDS91404.1 hypothetical protein ESCAB7627_3250 [Escherichia albertii TW07627]